MKKFKYLVCALLIGALLLPYTAFAEYSEAEYGYGEGVVKDPFETEENDGFSLAAASMPLTENEKGLINYIADKIPELNATIEIPEKYQLPETRFADIYTNYMGSLLQFEHPEIFYLSGAFGYAYKPDPQHTVTSLNLIYSKDYADFHQEFNEKTQKYYEVQDVIKVDEIRKAQAVIENEINNITAGTEGMTDLEKALYVHDYITANYEYDTRVNSEEETVREQANRTLDKMIEEKRGVCQGYTYLYMVAMKKLGIDCVAVPTDELHHIWNKIKLDGEWYNVDVTYDDPIVTNMSAVSHKYLLVNDEEIKALDPSNITEEYFYHIDENGNIITDENGEPIIFTEQKENSCHAVWNTKNWDGSPAAVSTSNTFSGSPLHSITGPTAYTDGSFFCFDHDNNLCEVIFENSQQVLREQYVLSRNYKWYGYGQSKGYYTKSQTDKSPYFSSTVALFRGKVYFNSPNAVYEFITKDTVKEVYRYDGIPDVSDTYFYGLRVIDNGLYVEYAKAPQEDVELISIPLPEEPETPEEPKPAAEVFPEFDEPLPCLVETPEVVENKITNEETQEEEVVSYNVSVDVTIPEEVTSKTEEAEKPVTVVAAQYDENGCFLGFAEVELTEGENNKKTASFTAGADCSSVKTFVWSGFIMPLAMAEAIGLTASQATE